MMKWGFVGINLILNGPFYGLVEEFLCLKFLERKRFQIKDIDQKGS